MNIWIVWNGDTAPEDRAIVEIFSDEQAAYEFVNDGECERQGYQDVSTEGPDGGPIDYIECFAVCETVAESHAGFLEALRGKMIRDMSAVEREAMRVDWDDENGVELIGERETDETS